MKYVLPINKNPLITTYNHHAFAMSIIQTHEKFIEWLCNHYIQLSYYPQQGDLTFDFYMDYIYCNPIFEREFLSDELLCQNHINIRKYIINAITSGKYVICCVDEYYVPGMLLYQKQHFEHNIMIYGIIDEEVLVAGYNERQHYAFWTIRMKELLRAGPNRITLLSLREGYEYRINIPYIQSQLRQLLNLEPAYPVGAYTKEGQFLGLEAIRVLGSRLETSLKSGELVEIRPFCVLRDYKRVMMERIKYLLSASNKTDIYIDVYATDKKKYEMFLLKLMKYNVAPKTVQIKDISCYFNQWIEQEKEQLTVFKEIIKIDDG